MVSAHKQVTDLIKDCRFKDTNVLTEDDFMKHLDSTIYEGNTIKYLDFSPRMHHSPKMIQLSEKICSMQSLELLNLAYNKLRTIPECLCNLTKLKGLYLAENPIEPKYYDLITSKLKLNFAFDLFLEQLKVKTTFTELSDLNLEGELKRDEGFEKLLKDYDFDTFPATLKKIIEILGVKNLKLLFQGTDLFNSHDSGQALLESNKFPRDLSEDAIIFAMHQGKIINFVLPSQGDDPPVWYFVEGSEQKSYGNFYMAAASLSAHFYGIILTYKL